MTSPTLSQEEKQISLGYMKLGAILGDTTMTQKMKSLIPRSLLFFLIFSRNSTEYQQTIQIHIFQKFWNILFLIHMFIFK
jgi:hypothetical protein